MPSQTFTQTAFVAASPDHVWAKLQQPETWEEIGGIERVFDPLIDEHGHLGGFSFESTAAGRSFVGSATPTRREEGRALEWRIETTEMRGAITVELASEAEGTALDLTMQIESVGMMSKMFFPMIAKAIGGGFAEAADEFAASLGR